MLTSGYIQKYRATYNRLSDDVDAVYASFEKNDKHLEIIRNALQIIHKHDAEEDVGLFLLHRHFEADAGKIFVERKYTPVKGHSPVLVTQAETISKAPKKMAAHRFSFDREGQVQPLEFTTDRSAGAASRRFLLKEDLSRELHKYLLDEGMTQTLGVGIFARTGTMTRATQVFLEETDFENRTSVVHVLPRLPNEVGKAIPTLWTFGENAFGCCQGQCIAYCSQHGNPGSGTGYCGHRRSGAHMVCV
jgi:hypothetical protein